jgi:hypothetical protein
MNASDSGEITTNIRVQSEQSILVLSFGFIIEILYFTRVRFECTR